MITDDEIDTLNAHAVLARDRELLYDTYEARGFGRRVGVLPLAGEVRRARERCAVRWALLANLPADLKHPR